MREMSGVEEPVTSYARSKGFLARKCQWIGRRGAPDKLFSKKGRGVFWIEFKRPGKDLEPHQEREIKRMREAGMTVHVIDNAEDGYALFD